MDRTRQILVIVATAINFAGIFILPLTRTWIRTGQRPVSFKRSDSVQRLLGLVYSVCLVLVLFSAVTFAFAPRFYRHLQPFPLLADGAVFALGLAVNLAALVWIAVGQYQMAETWRVGIFAEDQTRLITRGLFKLSRNPISMGVILQLLSVFLCLPNAVLLAVLAVGFVFIQVEVRLEEMDLLKKHGRPYQEYCQRTPRWLLR